MGCSGAHVPEDPPGWLPGASKPWLRPYRLMGQLCPGRSAERTRQQLGIKLFFGWPALPSSPATLSGPDPPMRSSYRWLCDSHPENLGLNHALLEWKRVSLTSHKSLAYRYRSSPRLPTITGTFSRNTLNKGSEGFSGGYWGSFAEILRPPGLFSQMCRPLISLRRGRCNL